MTVSSQELEPVENNENNLGIEGQVSVCCLAADITNQYMCGNFFTDLPHVVCGADYLP